MKMKYFVLYVSSNGNRINELYLKGKSMEFMEERINRYKNGALATSQWSLFTSRTEYGFIREVDPSEYPNLTKRDFLQINENRSYDYSDF